MNKKDPNKYIPGLEKALELINIVKLSSFNDTNGEVKSYRDIVLMTINRYLELAKHFSEQGEKDDR